MSDNRIFSPDACTVCGRLGDPHATWCEWMTDRLTRQAKRRAQWHEQGRIR